jgi:hypothetical protein
MTELELRETLKNKMIEFVEESLADEVICIANSFNPFMSISDADLEYYLDEVIREKNSIMEEYFVNSSFILGVDREGELTISAEKLSDKISDMVYFLSKIDKNITSDLLDELECYRV